MQHQLTAFFRRNVGNYTEKKYVLAVSGGVDSMVLLNAMITLSGPCQLWTKSASRG